MNRKGRLVAAGVLGAAAVAFGAFAAHGLPDALAERGYADADIARRVENLQTGARYQLATAAALLALGLGAPATRLWNAAAWLLTIGAVVFGGLLYTLAIAGPEWRWLGAVVPIGGVGLILGWVVVAIAGWRSGEPADPQRAAAELVRLEEVVSHQQRLLQDLDEVVTGARRDADQHAETLRAHEAAVRRLAEVQRSSEPMHDEKPPHY